MNTKQKAKNNSEKDFFRLLNKAVFGKNMENLTKYRDIKLVTTERRRNHLVSEPTYYIKKIFTENLFVIEIKKSKIVINKSVYLGLSVLDLSKTIIYEFFYEYVKLKYGENVKSFDMDTDSFIVHAKAGDICKDIAEDVEAIFDTKNVEIDRLLPIGKN